MFIRLIIRLFQLVFSAKTVFFSHNKSVNSVFQPAYQHSRTAPLPPLCSKLHGDVGVHSQTSLEHRQWRWSLDVVVARSVIAGGLSFVPSPRLSSARKFHLASHATLHCTVRTMVYLGSRYVFDIARIFPISFVASEVQNNCITD